MPLTNIEQDLLKNLMSKTERTVFETDMYNKLLLKMKDDSDTQPKPKPKPRRIAKYNQKCRYCHRLFARLSKHVCAWNPNREHKEMEHVKFYKKMSKEHDITYFEAQMKFKEEYKQYKNQKK